MKGLSLAVLYLLHADAFTNVSLQRIDLTRSKHGRYGKVMLVVARESKTDEILLIAYLLSVSHILPFIYEALIIRFPAYKSPPLLEFICYIGASF